MLIDLSFYCRACRGCRVHCRDTKTFPVVPRHGLVSCISVPDSMERHKTRLKAPKCLISLITVFLGRPVILVSQKVGQVQESLQRESVELDTQNWLLEELQKKYFIQNLSEFNFKREGQA